ncbi:MAG TPA: DUF3105 domain-containing protein [Myxococcota bacterium]|jgi:hypothetical protein
MIMSRVLGACVVAALGGALGTGCCYDDGHPQNGLCDIDGAVSVPNEGWTHVQNEDQLVYQHNPPASGPHFPIWASWGVHTDVVDRGNWVHNLEHGGIVLLIGSNATDGEKKLINDAYNAIPDDPECHHRRAVVTEDPKLDAHMAVVAADVVLPAAELTVDKIKAFAVGCRNHGPEDICY